MLINESYFIGPLTIAQLGQQDVVDHLNVFINTMEPEILRAALGYDLYEALIAGIDVGSDETIDEKWLNLLNGSPFTSCSGIKKKWVGLAGGENTQTVSSTTPEPLTITAGVTAGFSGRSFTKASLANWNLSLEVQDTGTVERGVVWDYVTGGGVQMLDEDYEIQPGEVWIIHYLSKRLTINNTSQSVYTSPLAGLIYAAYMTDLAKITTGSGYKQSKSENADFINPAQFICAAHNQAVRDFHVLWDFLDVNKADYAEYDSAQIDRCYFKTINPFGI